MVESSGKIYWTILIAVFLASLILIFYATNNFYEEMRRLSNFSGEEQADISEKHRFWIELDFGNGKKRLFEIAVENQDYPLAPALITTSEFGNFSVEMRPDGMISSVDGIKGKWGFYRNGTKVSESVADLVASSGDRFVLKIQP